MITEQRIDRLGHPKGNTFRLCVRDVFTSIVDRMPRLLLIAGEYWLSVHYEPQVLTQVLFVRTLSRDRKIYPKHEVFNPERFMDDPHLLDPRQFFFGFGRRYAQPPKFIFSLALEPIPIKDLSWTTPCRRHRLDYNGDPSCNVQNFEGRG
jgi:hypothetical protein